MDMATYFGPLAKKPWTTPLATSAARIHKLTAMVGPTKACPAVGVVEMPGYVNASCGSWPQCANISDPACGCLDYGWNHSSFAAFVREAEVAGVSELDVYR